MLRLTHTSKHVLGLLGALGNHSTDHLKKILVAACCHLPHNKQVLVAAGREISLVCWQVRAFRRRFGFSKRKLRPCWACVKISNSWRTSPCLMAFSIKLAVTLPRVCAGSHSRTQTSCLYEVRLQATPVVHDIMHGPQYLPYSLSAPVRIQLYLESIQNMDRCMTSVLVLRAMTAGAYLFIFHTAIVFASRASIFGTLVGPGIWKLPKPPCPYRSRNRWPFRPFTNVGSLRAPVWYMV